MLAKHEVLSYFIDSMFTKLKQTLFGLAITIASVIGVVSLAQPSAALTCAGTETSIIGGQVCDGAKDGGSGRESGIWAILILALNIMTAAVGVAAVGGLVYGAILYTSASDSQEQVKKAMAVIKNVVWGVIAYAFMYLLLNFIIPGGIFS